MLHKREDKDGEQYREWRFLVFVPIKASHSAGWWLASATIPLRALGKVNELPGTVWGLRNQAGHLASTPPFLMCGCHPRGRRRRCESRVPGWLGAICTMSVSLTSPKTTGEADSIPPLLSLYSGFPFSDGITSETRARSGLSLGFFIFSSSLVWRRCWRGGRDHFLVREGMRLLTGTGVGLGCVGVIGDSISGGEKQWDLLLLENGEMWEEKGNIRQLFSASTWGREKNHFWLCSWGTVDWLSALREIQGESFMLLTQ